MKLKWLDTFRRTEGISSAGVMWVQKSTELIILIRHNLCLAAAECWKQNIHGMELTFVARGNNRVDWRWTMRWLTLKFERETKIRWMNTNNESGLMLITFHCQCSVPAWQWHMARAGWPPGLAACCTAMFSLWHLRPRSPRFRHQPEPAPATVCRRSAACTAPTTEQPQQSCRGHCRGPRSHQPTSRLSSRGTFNREAVNVAGKGLGWKVFRTEWIT